MNILLLSLPRMTEWDIHPLISFKTYNSKLKQWKSY